MPQMPVALHALPVADLRKGSSLPRQPLRRLACWHRFVTRQQVASLGLGHLIGTPLLRAYMHGFFMHQRLWQKAQALAPGDTAAAQRAAAVAAQLERQRASRITLRKRLPKVRAATCGGHHGGSCLLPCSPAGVAGGHSKLHPVRWCPLGSCSPPLAPASLPAWSR